METLATLQTSINSLVEMLDQVILEQAGSSVAARLGELRQLATERRAGLPQAGDRLVRLIKTLSDDELSALIRGLILYFDLANAVEDLHRIRVLHDRELESQGKPRDESIVAAIRFLKGQKQSSYSLQVLLDQLRIEPVFTAHPTEAKRRTTRRVLRHLRASIQRLHTTGLLPVERAETMESILGDLTVLWQIDPIRPKRPSVLEEVERGLLFCEGLWDVVPALYQQMRHAVQREFPTESIRVPDFIRIGSWIGGDRDGNPFVTSEITAKTLDLLRQSAIEHHLATAQQLAHTLVMSDQLVPIDVEIRTAVANALSVFEDIHSEVTSISEKELYRRWLKVIELRLLRSASGSDRSGEKHGAYHSANELLQDVQLLVRSLNSNQGSRVANAYVRKWIDQIETFGLHFASLDVRQDSRVHRQVFTEICGVLKIIDDFGSASEEERQAILLQAPPVGDELMSKPLSAEARDLLELFRVIARLYSRNEEERLGSYIVSMTNSPSDLLIVFWLWRWAWKCTSTDKLPFLSIVPLFETITDLRNGPSILDQLLRIEAYGNYLRCGAIQPTQIVMVGYSDSTKDGGYLSASWSLFGAQSLLAAIGAKHNVKVTMFHGRGGALGRGGGPAARAILSLPPESVNGTMRLTEQGEVIAERYDDQQIALRHLEQITWATIQASSESAEPIPEMWHQRMDQLSERALKEYRELIELPGFMNYFDRATPISFIERLPLGSRPSRRRERKSLADLRAIPWTFSWTQNRHFIPAWFGLGSSLSALTSDSASWSDLHLMYDEWLYFRGLVDNAELAIAKADIEIAQQYSILAGDLASNEVWNRIVEEFWKTRASILLITRQQSLLEKTPWLQRSIQQRNPYVDPLNLIQIELINRFTHSVTEDESTKLKQEELIRLSIQGVAAGLRTTG